MATAAAVSAPSSESSLLLGTPRETVAAGLGSARLGSPAVRAVARPAPEQEPDRDGGRSRLGCELDKRGVDASWLVKLAEIPRVSTSGLWLFWKPCTITYAIMNSLI
jgi:hypothetical protein